MPSDNRAARMLAAKILLPAVPPGTLARPRLESRLDGALERRLTLVSGGAGFGKSTLVASWAARVHSAWYALSPEDQEPLLLADGLFEALRLRVPSLPDELPAPDAPRGPEAEADAFVRVEAAASLLCEALAERLGRDLVLVVEDVHELDGAVASAHLLERLCREAAARRASRADVARGAPVRRRPAPWARPGTRARRGRARVHRRRGEGAPARRVGGSRRRACAQ